MSTPNQIQANQQNAQLSTGPRSDEGKAAVRFNALKHGFYSQHPVIPGEDPAEYEALAKANYDYYDPCGADEINLVEAIIQSIHRGHRLDCIQSELIHHLVDENAASENPSPHPLGAIFAGPHGVMLDKLMRHQETAERTLNRARKELHRLQGQRLEMEMLAASAPAPAAAASPQKGVIGSVPKNPPQPVVVKPAEPAKPSQPANPARRDPSDLPPACRL
jgi:hypothetical protein